MKIESRLLILFGLFAGGLTVAYLVLSKEPAGGLMLLGASLLGLMPGLYYAWWHKRMGFRPEDLDDGAMEATTVIIDTFPGSSIWPITMGMGAFFTVLALVFGIWFLVPGLALVTTALVGGTLESRRGGSV